MIVIQDKDHILHSQVILVVIYFYYWDSGGFTKKKLNSIVLVFIKEM